MTHEEQEFELHKYVLSFEDQIEKYAYYDSISEKFHNAIEDFVYDFVSEEDNDEDLERSILMASKHGKVYTFKIDNGLIGTSTWAVCIGEFDSIKRKIKEAYESC